MDSEIMATVECFDDSRARRKIRNIRHIETLEADNNFPKRFKYRGDVVVDGEQIVVEAIIYPNEGLTNSLWRTKNHE